MYKNIGIDLDGVIYPWHDVVYERECLDKNVSNLEFWTKIHSLYSDFAINNLVQIQHYYGVKNITCENLELLNELSKEHALFYITNRNEGVRFATTSWMKRNNIPQRENLIFSSNKIVPVILNKIDLFVEDNIKNAIQLKPYCRVVIVKSMYNSIIDHDFETIQSFAQLKYCL